MLIRSGHTFLIGICLALTAGCMKMGQDFILPESPADLPPGYLESPAETSLYVPPDRWWLEFGDEQLNAIVENVVAGNPDIQGAAARVAEARSALTGTNADRYPALDARIQYGRSRQPAVNPVAGGRESVYTDNYGLSLPASFELDLWGKLSRATEAARADLLASEENRRTVMQSLIAESVILYLNIGAIERRIEVNRQSVGSYRRSLDLVDARYRRGLASVLDVRQARRILAQAEAQLPSLVEAAGRARQTLSVLQGRYPVRKTPQIDVSAPFQLPSPVPAGLPSDLLVRRPDISAAEANLAAASARIGVAKAARFPRISLTGSLGYTSDELNTLFDPASELWSLAFGGLQSVFDAGRLSANQRGAEARYARARADYARVVLNAFAEVEGALLTRRQQVEHRSRLLALLDESNATLEAAQNRYERGLVDYLAVLDAQQAVYVVRLTLIETEYTLLANRARLYRALGGGWENNIAAAGENIFTDGKDS